jgi:predicted nucleic acid-binding protein
MARPFGDACGPLVIVLDTNVLSAMIWAMEEPAVERWFDAQPTESIWTTTVTVFEIRFGLALLAAGRRRGRLDRAFLRAIDNVLDGRVLPFDRGAAEAAARIAANRRRIGRTIEIRDVQIAGSAEGGSRHPQHAPFRAPW